MKAISRREGAFTLTELLVIVAILAILIALAFPSIEVSKARANRAVCLNNLRQINLGIRMYSDDANDVSPSLGGRSTNAPKINLSLYSGYKKLMKSYVGLNGASSPQDRLFACPADKFYPDLFVPGTYSNRYLRQSLHDQPYFDYSSYAFNGGDNASTRFGKTNHYELPGLTGVKLSSIKHPARTVLVAEESAFAPWSWHNPDFRQMLFNRAKSMVSFADGHTGYVRIYWDSNRISTGGSFAMNYDPPDSYDYQWSGN